MISALLKKNLLKMSDNEVVYQYQRLRTNNLNSISGRELDNRSTMLSKVLFSLHNENKLKIVALFEPGIDFITLLCACLYSGTTIIPCPIPRSDQEYKRLRGIIADSQADIVVCSKRYFEQINLQISNIKCVEYGYLTNTSQINLDAVITEPEPNDIAVLQYSSGSTAEPKGVQVSYAMIEHNYNIVSERWGLKENSRTLSWLPHYHDMGLFGGILYQLLAGNWILVLSSTDFIKRPYNWLKLISEYQINLSGGPSFAYELAIEASATEDIAQLDLSCWKVAFCGADTITTKTYHSFIEQFSVADFKESSFFACYGLAEITLFAGGEPRNRSTNSIKYPVGYDLLPCFIPNNDTNLKIFDLKEPRLLLDNIVGEICFSSPSAARSYTTSELNGFIFEGQHWVRSGDLGFINGNWLQITGRLKDVLKVRGKTIFPVDFAVLANNMYSDLNYLFFYMAKINGTQNLVFFIECKNKNVDESYNRRSEALQLAFNQTFGVFVKYIKFLPRGRLPKTTSGKVKRELIFMNLSDYLHE